VLIEFSDECRQITRMKIPLDTNGNPKRFAYVEFGNNEDLQLALGKHEDVSIAGRLEWDLDPT
jgi:RNA recognition motif-containing protein